MIIIIIIKIFKMRFVKKIKIIMVYFFVVLSEFD